MTKYVKSIKFSTSGETYVIRDAEQKSRLDTLEPQVAEKADTTTVNTALAGKQNKLTAGANITIENDVISATGGSGGGAVDSVNGKTGTVVLEAADVHAATEAQGAKADTAVQPADIADMETQTHASGTYQTKLTSANAGNNVQITEESGVVKISATGGGSGSANWGSIGGTLSNQTDLQNALNAKISTGGLKTINDTSLEGSGNIELLTSSDVGTMAAESKDDYYTKTAADAEFLTSNQGPENTGKILGIDSTGEVVPVSASGIVTPEGEASVLDNSQPKNLFGTTTTQEIIPTENMLNDESEHCGYSAAQGVAGPFLSNFNQTAIRNKQLASVSCCIKTLSTVDDTYPFFIIDLGTNTFPSTKEGLANIVPAANWKTTYKKFFEVTLESSDLGHMENFKLDGSDPRVTYRNPDYLDSEGYLVIPTGNWVMFGDDRSGYGTFGYDRAAQSQTGYNQPFYYKSSSAYGQSSGNFGVSFFERTWETETITKQNFDAYLVTEESGEQVIHSDIIATALSDIEDLKERNPSSPLEGKWLSLIGDSITTFQGWSNVAPGSTSAAVYYPNSGVASPILDVNQTYWKKLIDRTGMNLLVNNSWSGSECSGSGASAVVSQTNDRCHQLHKTIDGVVVNPDYILINIGTNDFDHDKELGTWNGRGVLFPANPTTTSPNTFREAYAVMLYRLRQYYPLAKVFCCTIPCGNNEGGEGLNEINGTGYTLSEWNDAIREVATAFGVKVIEMATAGMDYYTLATLYGDGRVHPSEAGMERMYEIIRPAMENETTSNTSAPRLSKLMTGTATAISDSTASDVSGLVTDFNALLAALRARGVISAS